MTDILGGTDVDVSFTNIWSRNLNASLCEFPSVTSGISGDGFCIIVIKSCVEQIVAYVEGIYIDIVNNDKFYIT